jgi:hypothetical protein
VVDLGGELAALLAVDSLAPPRRLEVFAAHLAPLTADLPDALVDALAGIGAVTLALSILLSAVLKKVSDRTRTGDRLDHNLTAGRVLRALRGFPGVIGSAEVTSGSLRLRPQVRPCPTAGYHGGGDRSMSWRVPPQVQLAEKNERPRAPSHLREGLAAHRRL